jgi:endogenous inhibitor of DNA gyrase (YacG/DUF329 family)
MLQCVGQHCAAVGIICDLDRHPFCCQHCCGVDLVDDWNADVHAIGYHTSLVGLDEPGGKPPRRQRARSSTAEAKPMLPAGRPRPDQPR